MSSEEPKGLELHSSISQGEDGGEGVFPQKDYYAVMGLEKNASPETIHKTHDRLIRELYPTINVRSHQSHRKSVRRAMEINEAYTVLKDEKSKRKYDF